MEGISWDHTKEWARFLESCLGRAPCKADGASVHFPQPAPLPLRSICSLAAHTGPSSSRASLLACHCSQVLRGLLCALTRGQYLQPGVGPNWECFLRPPQGTPHPYFKALPHFCQGSTGSPWGEPVKNIYLKIAQILQTWTFKTFCDQNTILENSYFWDIYTF